METPKPIFTLQRPSLVGCYRSNLGILQLTKKCFMFHPVVGFYYIVKKMVPTVSDEVLTPPPQGKWLQIRSDPVFSGHTEPDLDPDTQLVHKQTPINLLFSIYNV